MFDWEAPIKKKIQELTLNDTDDFMTSSSHFTSPVTSPTLPRGSETLNAVLRELQDNDLKPQVGRKDSSKMIGQMGGHVTSDKRVHWLDSKGIRV